MCFTKRRFSLSVKRKRTGQHLSIRRSNRSADSDDSGRKATGWHEETGSWQQSRRCSSRCRVVGRGPNTPCARDEPRCSSHPGQNDPKLASAARRRLACSARRARSKPRVKISPDRITNTDSGAARVKKIAISPVTPLRRRSACERGLSVVDDDVSHRLPTMRM